MPSGAALAAASAALLALSYPKFNLGFLAWTAFLPLGLMLLRARNWKHAAALSYLCWFLMGLCTFYWIYPVCLAGGLSDALALSALLLLSAVMAAEGGLLGWMLFFLARSAKWFPLTAACALVALEWVKAEVLTKNFISFPWLLLGYSQWQYPPVIQMASITGAVGLSFFISYPAFSLAYAMHTGMKNWKRVMLGPLVSTVVLLSFGFYELSETLVKREGQLTMRISVLQPNIDQYRKWSDKYLRWIERRLNQQLPQAALQNPQLVVWPEAAVPNWLDASYTSWIGARAAGMKSPQLVGAIMQDEGRSYVRAVLFSAQGKVEGFYTKRQLVPFGEFVPMRALLERHAKVLGKMGEFDPGPEEQAPLVVNGTAIGPLICYESIFPSLARTAAASGARILVNLTNDGWYLDTSAPYQHFAANVFRAVENRRPLVRAANTGISGWIDRWGIVRHASALNTAAVLTFNIPLDKPEQTFYTQQGNLLAEMCLVVVLPFLIVGLIM